MLKWIPIRNNFSKRRRFNVENKSFRNSIDFDGFLVPIRLIFELEIKS